MIWVLAVVVVGLIAVLAELLLSYQKRAHDLRTKQNPLRRRIRVHSEAMQESVGGIQKTADEQEEYLVGELTVLSQRGQELLQGLTEMERSVFGDGYDPHAPVPRDDEELIQDREPEGSKVDEEEETPETLLRQAREYHQQEVNGHRTSLQRDLDVVRRTLSLLETKVRRGVTAPKKG
ncbi:MAG: hypothetical protein HN712_06885 [Gemmatimonadetes bacterium]|nr:hypothetical protein [Gemmatimonadota bacterium]MBT6146933.1 hypothetical protein [Gemmatimonadota bacterium]MBT7860019.1 hypothetical protein [Gemmatimonadota bacterium]